MKTKRCTNSSCRKVFRVEKTRCPYCGKQYPRIAQIPYGTDQYMVVLTSWGNSKWSAIEAIRLFTNLELRDAKTLADKCPSLVRRGVSGSQAEALKEAFRDAGGDARILPAGCSTKGIYVLPERAG